LQPGHKTVIVVADGKGTRRRAPAGGGTAAAIGVPIAGLLLAYLVRGGRVREFFATATEGTIGTDQSS
jgi:hypothetical protein